MYFCAIENTWIYQVYQLTHKECLIIYCSKIYGIYKGHIYPISDYQTNTHGGRVLKFVLNTNQDEC